MNKLLSLLIILTLYCCNISSQNYNNIINYHFNSTPTHGVKIITNLPFTHGVQMPTVKIEGYNFAKSYNSWIPSTLNLTLVWYVYNNQFDGVSASSYGGTAPNVWLSNENGKVVIFLDQKIYFQRFTVSVFAQGKDEKPEYFAGWRVTDAPLGGTQQKQVIYKNIFSGNVGIGVENPNYELEVAGSIRSTEGRFGSLMLDTPTGPPSGVTSNIYYPGHFLTIGSKPGIYRNNVLELKPGGSNSGPLTSWFQMYTSANENESTKKVLIHTNGNSFLNGGNIGIGTESPQYKLDVNGDIRLTNLNIPHHKYIGASLGDNFRYKERVMGHYAISWMNDPWNTGGSTLWQAGYGGIKFFTQGQFRMAINGGGNIGIGTENPKNLLDVNGTIRAKEVKVELENWSDFVFDKDYKLPSLQEVEAHINEYKHLPDIPSEAQVKEEGVNLAEMQAKLLQKIEELTLYVIKQEKEIESLKKALSDKE